MKVMTVTFFIEHYVPCNEFEPDLDALNYPVSLPLSKDNFKLLFGKNADVANEHYRALYDVNQSGLYNSLRQALKRNFDVTCINAGVGNKPTYTLMGTMNNLVLYGEIPYLVSVEVHDELSANNKAELVKKICSAVNAELSRFEVRTGATTRLIDVSAY